ncbi:MAG: GntR family transcriptional regulator, partial [Rhizobiaceae bacterium]
MNVDLAEMLAPENWTRKHGGPLYTQLSQHIGSAIKNGQLMQGDALPPERELAQISKLSRVTVRKAVQELVREGLVVQKQGSGTSVASVPGKVEQSLSLLTSFSEDMQRRGWTASSKWIERGIFSPSPEETMALGLAPSDKV